MLVQVEMGARNGYKNDKIMLCWKFEYRVRKETTAWRPDVTIEYEDHRLIQININEKVKKNLLKCQQLAYEIRKRRPGDHVKIIPVVIECMAGTNKLREQIAKVLETNEKVTRTWR